MKFIIHRKTLIGMLFIGLTLLGYISYKNLPVELLPSSELPMLIVQISSRIEVDPTYMENKGVIPLEGAIGTLEGIEEIESSATQRRGTIYIYYNQNINTKYAYLKLQEKINVVKSSLPDEFTVIVGRVDLDQLINQFMGLQVRGTGGIDRVRNIADQKIVPELENIDGIANAEVYGGQEKSVEIILDEEVCKAHGLTLSQVRNLITSNQREKVFVGKVSGVNKEYFVNVTAEYSDIKDLENMIVSANGPVILRDIADIYVGLKEETSYSRVNGKEAITITLINDSQVNLIDLSHKVIDVIDNLNEKLKPEDIEIVIQSNTAEIMEANIDKIIQLALIGGVLAIFILWMFLRNLRLIVAIALAIPISIFTAFNLFYAFNISINSLTLVGMALAIGMLLDNSIVVLENIYRHAAQNKNPDQAVILGTKEVARPVIAATLTTITVFLPFIFSSNSMIKLMGNHIGVSIISTLLISLFVALLLIPMITHFFMRKQKGGKLFAFEKISLHNRLIQIYILFLKSCMRYPARTIIGAVAFFFTTILISLALSLNTLEEVETTDFSLYITMPSGATLESTDEVVKEIEKRLENIEEKKDIVSEVSEEDAIVTIDLKEDYQDINDRNLAQIKNDIEQLVENISTAEISTEQPQSSQRYMGGSGTNQGIQFQKLLGIGVQSEKVVIKGQDFEKMRNTAEDVQYYLEELSSIQSVSLNVSSNRPEIHLYFDTWLMSQYDIPLTAVASELNSFQNEFASGGIYKEGTEEYDIIIKNKSSDEETRRNIDDLRKLQISANEGAVYELDHLSEIIYAAGMSTINRVNQEKQIELTYRFINEVNDSKSLLEASRFEIDEIIAGLKLPSGVAVEIVHDESELGDFYFLIAAAFILIYIILASVFESFSTPVVLMFSIPLAAIGSFLALIFTGNSLLNANTLTGFLILLGVVVNNGIILIDYSKLLRKRGYYPSRALMMAGLARIRPILITAITTIVAMFPLAMGQAEYVSTIGAPFAITVIGGLSLSTLFTLVFIPTLNSGLESALSWISKLDWKIKAIQSVIFIIACWFIYFKVENFIWQLIDLFLIIILIPGLTFFIKTSLRRATTKVIGKDEAIRIRIQKLVKIYDRDSRFIREWKAGKKIAQRFSKIADLPAKHKLQLLIWQIPLLGFLIYFIYFYMDNGFWLFVLVHLVYFYFFYIWKPFSLWLGNLSVSKNNKIFSRLVNIFGSIFFWGFPLFNLVVFQLRWGNIALVIFIGFVWYFALLIYTTSNRLFRDNINIQRLDGRFRNIRRRFYSFVLAIPVIGKKKNPFKALNGVSVEIGKGMFGLLGPNGAGKTTLMRVICGILEQSYGKVWVNNIDASEKREELQGLIGYLPQEFGTYENMTAYEFLNYQAILKNILDKAEREKIINYVIGAVHMDEYKHQKIGSFSGGMKQRMGIAQILLHLPRILVVDEPTAGLDPRERIRFRNLLVELSRERIVIFSTHIIEDISSSCNKVAVLNRGEVKYYGDPLDMTKIAEGHVWQFHVPTERFESLQKDLLVVHHMRDGDQIRVRCLSENQPVEQAKVVRPSLEDAYLWLLKKKDE
jgi:multidrug efflux pump subunit AcrB/ABC-type multidrug transport system ATPase subunit